MRGEANHRHQWGPPFYLQVALQCASFPRGCEVSGAHVYHTCAACGRTLVECPRHKRNRVV